MTIRALLVMGLSVGASAQWLHYPTPGIPRTADGKPNLAAPVPKTTGGVPDLTGLWQRARRPNQARQQQLNGLAVGSNLANNMAPGAEIPPMLPGAAALYEQRAANFYADRPSGRCLPHGIPDQMLIGVPMKIIQNPGLT